MNVVSLEEGRGMVKDPGRKGWWSQCWTGARYYPSDPRAGDIDILDIAHALGNLSRYGGHCRFYSVAEHSVLVSKIVSPELALEGLMHDATEAYLGDLTRPVRMEMGFDSSYLELDRLARRAIANAFDLMPDIPHEVEIADVRLVVLEKRVLLPRADPWYLNYPEPDNVAINCWLPYGASLAFLRRYCELTGEPFEINEMIFNDLKAKDDLAFGQARML
jgi:hypothetical protein